MNQNHLQNPDWVNELLDYLAKKPACYKQLVKGAFGIIATSDNPQEGFAARMGHLFARELNPQEMRMDLHRYQIVKDSAAIWSLDLLKYKGPGCAEKYQESAPLKRLALGYLGRKPTLEEVERLFSAYDTIESRLRK